MYTSLSARTKLATVTGTGGPGDCANAAAPVSAIAVKIVALLISAAAGLFHLLHDVIEIESGRLLALRELPERLEELAHVGLRRLQHIGAPHEPVVVGVRRHI